MKNNIIRKLILVVVLLNGSYALHASCQVAEYEPEFYFVMWLEGEGVVAYPLDEHPNVTYNDGMLKITTDVEEFSIEPDKVSKFTINDSKPNDDLTGIDENYILSQKLKKGKDYMSFVGCRAGMDVYVYSMSGMLIKTAKTDSDGTLYLSLEELGSGVYIVKSEKITCKILKK